MSHHIDRSSAAPDQSARTIERLAALLQELTELLDLNKFGAGPGTLMAIGGASDLEKQLVEAARRLDRMAELVHAAMQGNANSIGSPLLTKARPVTLGEAVQHAADVLEPLAKKSRCAIMVDVSGAAESIPAGGLYTVVLNALQNAIEATARRGQVGKVTVVARADAAPTGMGYGRDSRDWYLLEITDNGAGLPGDASRVFDLGFTTKRNGAGVGLAVAKNVVQGMGGVIELLPGVEGGAVLRVRFPSLSSVSTLSLGGAA
ncbi:MAG: ATP-binding protein [Phycisphaerales bacterium]|jgi:signal transduction histidine kinase